MCDENLSGCEYELKYFNNKNSRLISYDELIILSHYKINRPTVSNLLFICKRKKIKKYSGKCGHKLGKYLVELSFNSVYSPPLFKNACKMCNAIKEFNIFQKEYYKKNPEMLYWFTDKLDKEVELKIYKYILYHMNIFNNDVDKLIISYLLSF
jgi:hypothetical protein